MGLNKRLDYIDLLRVYFCIAILTYHMGILQGGYLAVCSFFVLSGFLAANAFQKEQFSVIKYYKSRFMRVYLPMVLVVLCSLTVCLTVLSNEIWVCMKREVTSLLLGYNNFWQLSANLDYFARHVDSPYMHLWYVAILLQLELIFPIIYLVMQFFSKKINRYVPVVLCFLLGIASMVYFIYDNQTKGLMHAYYNTFTRCFSWIMGIALCLLHNINGQDNKKYKNQVVTIILLLLFIGIQTVLFIFVSADNKYYVESMIASTLIAGIILTLSKNITKPLAHGIRAFFRYLSDISYYIFLVQYPVIYMLQYAHLSPRITGVLTVTIVLALAASINLVMRSLKDYSLAVIIKLVILLAFVGGAFYGGYRFVVSKDMQTELEQMQRQMAIQEEQQRIRQQEYEAKKRQEQEKREALEEERRKEELKLKRELEQEASDIERQLELIEQHKERLKKRVTDNNVVFVGDSVLLGASTKLYEVFPNCYVDAKVSRTTYAISDILIELKARKLLGEFVVINCGANGDCPESVKDEIMEILSDRQVFWLTTTNNQDVNDTLIEYAGRHDNLHIVDWMEISKGHDEYFAADGIHLELAGAEAYAQAICNALYDYQVIELDEKKQKLLEQKQELDEKKKELNTIP